MSISFDGGIFILVFSICDRYNATIESFSDSVNSLPSIIRAAVVEVADNYQVSPALAAMSALSTASFKAAILSYL